ncbi:MAG: hydrogenase maturation nickel metallochaperone HypA [Planctomycetota bacterium]
MHEMSIAASLVEHVLSEARQQQAVWVQEVEVQIGVLQLVVPEALEMAFSAITEGTLAAGATLKIVPVPARARCRQCEQCFEPAVDDYLCPKCQLADVEIVGGREIVLTTIVCETQDSLAPS